MNNKDNTKELFDISKKGMNIMNNNEEKIEEIIGFDIKVRTNNNEEKILRFDFKNSKESNSTISINKDYDRYGDYVYTVEIRHECICYSKEII